GRFGDQASARLFLATSGHFFDCSASLVGRASFDWSGDDRGTRQLRRAQPRRALRPAMLLPLTSLAGGASVVVSLRHAPCLLGPSRWRPSAGSVPCADVH